MFSPAKIPMDPFWPRAESMLPSLSAMNNYLGRQYDRYTLRTYPGKKTANNPANNRLMEIAHAVPCFCSISICFAMRKAPGLRAKSRRLTASRCVKGKLSEARVKGIGPRPGEYATAKTALALVRTLHLGGRWHQILTEQKAGRHSIASCIILDIFREPGP
ncbi:hypothetical protein J3458_018815 [Metarhizium acridum]|uniref:uncharacterized protein n=1 Tax=Metarhizium acridum TaxID=92637 RepID=UPI001C6B8777|nr:hypothetical protein J3458_018815 [Metarhizium acridum]